MSHQLLNTLYVTSEGAYLRLDHDTLRLQVGQETRLQVPLHHLGAVVCFGDAMISPALLARCAEEGRSVAFLSATGRFRCRMEGPTSGNVLLRRAQHQTFEQPDRVLAIARAIVAGKLQNLRHSLLRSARDAADPEEQARLRRAADEVGDLLAPLSRASDPDTVRGYEGEAAHRYFQVLALMVRPECRADFAFTGRVRRPPRDRLNSLLSFLYALLLNDTVSAAEGVGLDSQLGYLHGLRPGRPGLGLDLMEELRPVLADRLALTLVNRQQLSARDFAVREGGAVELTDDGRKQLLVAYQKRKQDEVTHPVLERKLPLGLVPHIQARLLARHPRGEVPQYTPFLYR